MTIEVTTIKDSISPSNKRITTIQCRYPRIIHSEVMTHRVFSRNASSSRAIPVNKLIEDVERDPFIPTYWGKNQKGMQAREELNANDRTEAHFLWCEALENAVESAKLLRDLSAHKQLVNRILEPFSHINVVITSTNFANFLALRDHEDAQPEIRELAVAVKTALESSTPTKLTYGQWHLPYITDEEKLHHREASLIKVSVARCARVSYLTHDGKETTVEADLELYNRLVGSTPLHASPTEHQALADPFINDMYGNKDLHGNFEGWIQYRKTLKNEYVS